MYKTKMCRFFAVDGCVRGHACRYAHAPEELVARPLVAEPRMCLKFLQKSFCWKDGCQFLHGNPTAGASEETPREAAGQNARDDHPKAPDGSSTSTSRGRESGISSASAQQDQQRQWDSSIAIGHLPSGLMIHWRTDVLFQQKNTFLNFVEGDPVVPLRRSRSV